MKTIKYEVWNRDSGVMVGLFTKEEIKKEGFKSDYWIIRSI